MFARTDGRKRTFHLDMDVPPNISFEKLCKLIENFYTGNQNDVQIFKLSQMRHAIVIVQYWAVFHPRKVADMVQAAYVGICECSQKLLKQPKKEPSHVLNLMRMYMHRAIMDFIENDNPIMRVELRTVKKKQLKLSGVQLQSHHKITKLLDITDLLDLTNNKQERQILEHLSYGNYTHQEICMKLGVTEWTIRRLILRLRESLNSE